MISYAQNLEDVMLSRAFGGEEKGFYIDVGAMDPVDGSVTKYFYDKGWQGINIEPVERFSKRLCDQRERDINLNIALGEKNERLVIFDFEAQGISTFDKEFANYFTKNSLPYREREIEVTTLADVCNKYVSETIDFLKIDVEGWEGKVLQGGDWSRFRPRIIVLEATKPYSHDPLWQNWEPYLLAQEYMFVYFDGLNRFYIRSEEPQLSQYFAVPPNVLDDFQPHELVRLQKENAVFQAERELLKAEYDSLKDKLAPFNLDRKGVLGKIGRALLRKG